MKLTSYSGEATCPNCQTTQTVDRDEDGAPALETRACAQPGCGTELCEHCPQFECGLCQQIYCLRHRIEYADMAVCPECLRSAISEGAREAQELQIPVELMGITCEDEDDEDPGDYHRIMADRCPPRE